ncbi:MAG: hypothetical protein ACLP59_33905 [Bryobacteraceae bacterium]
MRFQHIAKISAATLLLAAGGSAGVVDRVAVVVGREALTESEVLEDLRLTEFLNHEPLDLSPAARREAAEHLVDQELIRREMNLSGFIQPPASEADILLRTFRQGRFHSAAEYQAALAQYGITEAELKRRLLWQLTAVRFIDFRFGAQQPEPNEPAADRAASDAPLSGTDRQMEAWLKQARADANIAFQAEAFQ